MPSHRASEKPIVSNALALYALMCVVIAVAVVLGLVAQ